MLKIALVSYLNTRPFTDGLNHYFKPEELMLDLLPPAKCAESLLKGDSDLALVPVGSLPDFRKIKLMKDHCIGANGAVGSVFLFSRVPVEQIDTLILDRHSRTSNALARILLNNYWKKEVVLEVTGESHFDRIAGNTAGVAIGDKAYKLKSEFEFAYDLSEVWKDWTGLPFVFAVWAYLPEKVNTESLEQVRIALEWGRRNIIRTAEKWGKYYGYSEDEAIRYLSESLQFSMDSSKHIALDIFIKHLKKLKSPDHSIV